MQPYAACCGIKSYKVEIFQESFGICKEELGEVSFEDELPIEENGNIKEEEYLDFWYRLVERDDKMEKLVKNIAAPIITKINELPKEKGSKKGKKSKKEKSKEETTTQTKEVPKNEL
ncbi:hypothetical protein C0J52_04649 [Blattella germanica]|nr:hypothetical protein C0J52_04649 [Blattella germanica]